MEKWIRLPTIVQLFRVSSFGRVSSFRHLPLRKAASRGILLKTIPTVTTYFETLGVGNDSKVPAFDIDLGQLRSNYLKFQQRVHPDRYGNKNEQEYAHAQHYSSFINKAYQTLRDPLSRAKYILQLNNISISESESLEDPELLMKILDTRERLEEATDENEAKNIKDESEVRINEIITKLSQAFKSNDLVQAKALTIRLQYWYNIREAAIEWEPGKPIEIHH